jgi:hypothetical protein
MKKIIQETQMNGVSIGWGARTLVLGFATTLVGLGKENLIVLVVGIVLLLFAFGLLLSRTTISYDPASKKLFMKYRNLFRSRNLTHDINDKDYVTFYNENHNPNKVDFILVSTNWYPVKNSSYFIVLKPLEGEMIILSECVDLKETFALCKEMSREIGLEFRSPLKKRG